MSDKRVAGLNPGALTLVEAAKLFTKLSRLTISVEMLQADIAAGAPTNANGTLHLVTYAAWLNHVRRGEQDG